MILDVEFMPIRQESTLQKAIKTRVGRDVHVTTKNDGIALIGFLNK